MMFYIHQKRKKKKDPQTSILADEVQKLQEKPTGKSLMKFNLKTS